MQLLSQGRKLLLFFPTQVCFILEFYMQFVFVKHSFKKNSGLTLKLSHFELILSLIKNYLFKLLNISKKLFFSFNCFVEL